MTRTSNRQQNYLLTPVNWFILFWIFSVVAFVVFVLMGFFLQSHEVKIYLGWLLNYIYFHTAHSLIQSIRRKITDLSSNTTIVKSNISLIREQVATILYIIQEFYSNTNWVELHGSTIYEDFGEVLFLNYVDTISNQKKDKCMNKVINFFYNMT